MLVSVVTLLAVVLPAVALRGVLSTMVTITAVLVVVATSAVGRVSPLLLVMVIVAIPAMSVSTVFVATRCSVDSAVGGGCLCTGCCVVEEVGYLLRTYLVVCPPQIEFAAFFFVGVLHRLLESLREGTVGENCFVDFLFVNVVDVLQGLVFASIGSSLAT